MLKSASFRESQGTNHSNVTSVFRRRRSFSEVYQSQPRKSKLGKPSPSLPLSSSPDVSFPWKPPPWLSLKPRDEDAKAVSIHSIQPAVHLLTQLAGHSASQIKTHDLPSQLLQSFLVPELYLLQLSAYSVLCIWHICTQDITEKGGFYNLKGFPFFSVSKKVSKLDQSSGSILSRSQQEDQPHLFTRALDPILLLLNPRWYLSICYISHIYICVWVWWVWVCV